MMNAAAKLLRPATPTIAAAATRHLIFHRPSSCSCRAFFASSSSLNATQNNTDPSPPTKTALLPIGVFIDLDNVAPKTHSRKDAQKFIFPLLQLGRLINQKRLLSPSFNESMSHTNSPLDEMKKVQRATAIQFEAFGNLATRSYVSEQQKEITSFDQEYIPWTPDDELEYGGYAQSGYDPNFDTVRCGICGWKAKLTKKKRTKYKNMGYTDEYEMLEEELMSHMKSLHDREQKKRIARMGQSKKKGGKKKKKLQGKELIKYNKYQAAQVGLQRGEMTVSSATGKVKMKRRNDSFKVLREIGVSVTPSDNVDADLIASAEKWLSRIVSEYHNNDVDDADVDAGNNNEEEDDDEGSNRDDDDNDEQQLAAVKKESSNSYPAPIGVLVIYSKDGDMVPLIENARRHRFITVSVTNKRTQTSSLTRSSDIIVGQGLFGNWINEGENGISDDYDEDEDDDEYGTVDANDEIDDELDAIERLFRDSLDDIGWEEGETSLEDLSEVNTLDDNDWEEGMFDESDLVDKGSADGHEHDYEIRKLGNAPSWDSLKSLSSSNDNSVHAISSSDVGHNFMISVQGVQNDIEGITRWHLADDSVHNNPVKDIDTSMEMKPTTMKQLRREIMPWDSVYSSRGGDRLTEKKDESNQKGVNQEEKTPKKQKKRQKKATKEPKPATEDEIAAAELKRALKIERNKAKALAKKERKEAAAEKRKVEATKLAAKIATLEGFIDNTTTKDATLEDFVYNGTGSNLAVKRLRRKLKYLEGVARKLKELRANNNEGE